MARLLKALLIGVWALASLEGCAFLRSASTPIPAWHAQSRAPSTGCLLVLLPGLGDDAHAFHRSGVLQDMQADAGCDVLMVDAHFSYYREQNLVTRLSEDILQPARARGYGRIWLVGVSLGGYGAILTARANPSLVDGVVLVAPMLGVPPHADDVSREIREAGGIGPWSPGPVNERSRHHFTEPRLVWSWLDRESAASAPRVHLAFGMEDGLATTHQLLADALPEGNVVRASGGHDWPTWRRLLRIITQRRPWRAS